MHLDGHRISAWGCLVILPVCIFLAGCRQRSIQGGIEGLYLPPLAVQQISACDDLAGGNFVSLADFEACPDGPPGHRQIANFTIIPAGAAGGSIGLTAG